MTESRRLLVMGASGHAKEVVSLARLLGYKEFALATSDGSGGFWGMDALRIEAGFDEPFGDWDVMVAIGDNQAREQLMQRFAGLRFVSLVAPTAVLSEGVVIGAGCYVGANAYVGADTVIGDGVIVNVGAVVGHDCEVGAFSQVGPRATVLGKVSVGDGVFLGAGCVVNHGGTDEPLVLAERVSVGMGVLVTQSVLDKGATLIPKPNVIALG